MERFLSRVWQAHRVIDQTGAAAVEFALVLPVLILLVLGAADYGMMMGQGASLQGATRALAEYIRNSPECSATGLSSSACTTGINNFVSALQTNDTSLSSASFSFPGVGSVPLATPSSTAPVGNYCTCVDGTSTSCSSGVCSVGSPADTRILQYVKVTATLSVNPIIPYSTLGFPSSVSGETATRLQ